MKKIFTLMLAAISTIAASAANFELLFGDTPVTDGATYTTGYTVRTLEQGGRTAYIYKQNSDLYLTGSKGRAVTVEVKSDKNVNVCSLDGLCVACNANNNFTVVKQGTLTGGKDDLAIDREKTVFNTNVPTLENVTVNVKVTSGGESVSVTVVMTNEESAGVGNVIADNANWVVMSGSKLNYHVAEPTDLKIYTILGAKIKSQPVDGSGAVSLDALPKGVYIYRAGRLSGKIVVK